MQWVKQQSKAAAKRYNVSRGSSKTKCACFPVNKVTAAAQEAGLYDDEIIPMDTVMKLVNKETGAEKDVEVTVDRDECNRPGDYS